MKKWFIFAVLSIALLVGSRGALLAPAANGRTDKTTEHKLTNGWVIGQDRAMNAVILHTQDGGKSWRVEGDSTLLRGYRGNDISAVDEQTAWAALGSANGGKIIHTGDGGLRWVEQAIPAGVEPIKQVKGLSRHVAWAVGIHGTVLHTTNGGKLWSIVPHPSVTIVQVNRMDAVGRPRRDHPGRGVDAGEELDADVWIVDERGGRRGMIHTQDNGVTWRQEFVDYSPNGLSQGLHMLTAHSRSVVWCAAWDSGELYRTVDGGDTWEDAGPMSGPNDIDDMSSPTPDTLWAVQNLSGDSGGKIFHVRVESGHLFTEEFDPVGWHIYEGITSSDDLHAVAVGSKAVDADPSLPLGIILATEDGGSTWTNQAVPVDDVAFWKVSFVGSWR